MRNLLAKNIQVFPVVCRIHARIYPVRAKSVATKNGWPYAWHPSFFPMREIKTPSPAKPFHSFLFTIIAASALGYLLTGESVSAEGLAVAGSTTEPVAVAVPQQAGMFSYLVGAFLMTSMVIVRRRRI
jgi:hypothetical protein